MTQWPWISHIIAITTTTTNNISVAVSTNDCCCFCISPQLDPNLNMLQLLHILLQPPTPKSLNVSRSNLYLCIVTVAYHEDFSNDDSLHTLQVRRNNLHCTLLYRPEKLSILFQWPKSPKFSLVMLQTPPYFLLHKKLSFELMCKSSPLGLQGHWYINENQSLVYNRFNVHWLLRHQVQILASFIT
jgi:hypothetical protein